MNPWRGLGRLPRELWVLFIATLVNRAGTMALPFLTLYVTRGLGLTAGRAAYIGGCASSSFLSATQATDSTRVGWTAKRAAAAALRQVAPVVRRRKAKRMKLSPNRSSRVWKS